MPTRRSCSTARTRTRRSFASPGRSPRVACPHRVVADGPEDTRQPARAGRGLWPLRRDDPRQPSFFVRRQPGERRAPAFRDARPFPGRFLQATGTYREGRRRAEGRRCDRTAVRHRRHRTSSARRFSRPVATSTSSSCAASRSTPARRGTARLALRADDRPGRPHEPRPRDGPTTCLEDPEAATCSRCSGSRTSTSAPRVTASCRSSIRGLDVYDPTTGVVRSDSTDDVACWFIDTAYDDQQFFVRHAYFLGADDPYDSQASPPCGH